MSGNKIPCIQRLYANTTSSGLTVLFTLLPFAFIITEFIHAVLDIKSHGDGIDTVIKENFQLARGILASLTSIMFGWLMFGGIHVRSNLRPEQLKLEGNTPNWWIAQGFEGCGQFLVLASFQYAYYGGYKYVDGENDITGSMWFWFVITSTIGLILWLYLNRNVPMNAWLPSDKFLNWYKIYTIVLFSLWLGFNPTAVEYEVATLVLIFITGLVRLYIINTQKVIQVQVSPPTNLTCNLLTIRSLIYLFIPAIIFGASFYNHGSGGNTKLVVKYIYAVSLGLMACVYSYYTLDMVNQYRLNPTRNYVASEV
jgi:hypothetical protein